MRLLPKAPDTFVGRVEELARIRGFFSKRRLFFLEGLEGVGKTSLALTLANGLEERSPGRVFWVQCRAGWQADSFLHEILAWLPEEARESFVRGEERSPSGIQDRFLRLVSLINSHGASVFVDDLQYLESGYLSELLSLLETYLRNSLFFFITRERPKLAPMERLEIFEERLEGLGAAEGLSLLENILASHGHDPSAHRDVLEGAAKKLGGHPLLIRTFAALILEGLGEPGAMLENLPDFFQEMERDLFQKIMEGLAPEELALLRLLSVSRVPLPRELTGEPHLREKLERRFLLLRDEKGRFFTHSLIREFILRGLEKEGAVPIHSRLADHFREYLDRGDGDPELAREVLFHYFQAERPGEAGGLLLAWGGRMCSHGYYEELLRSTASLGASSFRLGILRANVLSILGRGGEGVRLLEDLEKGLSDEGQRAEVRMALAGAYLNMGRLGSALEYYLKALDVLKASGDGRGSVKALNYITFIHGFRSERSKAFARSDEALGLARELKDDAALAHALRMRAVALLESGRHEEALEASRQGLEKARDLGSLRLTCWSLLNLGNALMGLGRLDEARAPFEESLASGRSSFDSLVIGFSCIALARLHRETGALEDARAALAEAGANFLKQGNCLGEASTKSLLAALFLELDRRKEAESLLKETVETAAINQHFALEIAARESLAHLHLEKGEAKEAAALVEMNLERLPLVEREESEGEARLVLAEAFWRLRETKKMAQNLKLACKTGKERDLPFLTARALFLAGSISAENADTRAAWMEEAGAVLERLSGSRRRLARRYFDRIERLAREKYFVKTREGERIAERDEVESLRARRDEFTFFFDLAARSVWEKEKGEVEIFGKRILSTLLIFLVKNAGRGFTQEQLFTSVWGYEFDDLTSPGEVRKNISRLRDLIEPDRRNSRYVRLAEGFMKEKGKYFFDMNRDFCFVEEMREG